MFLDKLITQINYTKTHFDFNFNLITLGQVIENARDEAYWTLLSLLLFIYLLIRAIIVKYLSCPS